MIAPPPLQPGPTHGLLAWLNRLREFVASCRVTFDPGQFAAVVGSRGTSLRLRGVADFDIVLTAAPPDGSAEAEYSWRLTYRDRSDPSGWALGPANQAGGPGDDPAVEGNGNMAVPLTTNGHPTRVPASRSRETGAVIFYADRCG